VVNARMSDLIRRMTLERGLDPRDFTIYAYGGGGGTHAALFSRGLGISEFVVPQSDAASVWSALGVAVADVVDVYEQPIHQHAPFDPGPVGEAFADVERQAEREIGRDHPHITELGQERYASCKYGMQVFEVEADVPGGELDDAAMARIVGSFERVYAERFGPEAGYREAGVQLTRVGLRVRGRVRKPRLDAADGNGAGAAAKAKSGEREVYWIEHGRKIATDILDGERLRPGDRLAGPAIVDLPDTTIVVRPTNELSIDRFGNAVVRLQAEGGPDREQEAMR
jgi:N-methylhydantoinase A